MRQSLDLGRFCQRSDILDVLRPAGRKLFVPTARSDEGTVVTSGNDVPRISVQFRIRVFRVVVDHDRALLPQTFWDLVLASSSPVGIGVLVRIDVVGVFVKFRVDGDARICPDLLVRLWHGFMNVSVNVLHVGKVLGFVGCFVNEDAIEVNVGFA